MKKLFILIITLVFSLSVFAQKDVTKFLGFPVDGSKSEMIRNLRSKGFKLNTLGNKEFLSGRFNGTDVEVFIVTEKGKVSRIMVCDKNTVNVTDIKIRFNRLCEQFKNNNKYISFSDHTIPDKEDIQYNILINKKRYEAVFYQLPEGDDLEKLRESFREQTQSKYTLEQLENPSDEIELELFAESFLALSKAVKNKSVWFMISEHFGNYYITMYYDNELNMANGEDL